jgi:hypothetical protein
VKSPRAESNRQTSRLQRAPFPNSVQRQAIEGQAAFNPKPKILCPRPDSNGRPPPSQSGVLIPLNYKDVVKPEHSRRWFRTTISRVKTSRAATAPSGSAPFAGKGSNLHKPSRSLRSERSVLPLHHLRANRPHRNASARRDLNPHLSITANRVEAGTDTSAHSCNS